LYPSIECKGQKLWIQLLARFAKKKYMTTKIHLTTLISFFFISSFHHLNAYFINSENDTVPLFASDEVLKFTLLVDSRELKKDNAPEPEYTDGQLILHEATEDKTFDIKVRPRGNSRRFMDFCTFPPLKLNFKKKAVEGTVFESQDKLKLVAYCKDLDLNETYVLKEYLVYKILNCVTPYSNNVRLAQITYKDSNDKGKDVTRYGFLVEDDDNMAERNGGQITESLMSNHDRCERNSLDLFTLFQFMIGNTDWWIASPKKHNVNVMVLDNGNMIPVPYDFDYCGLVDAKYAVTAEELPITSVKDRLFRGYCRLPGTYEIIADKFNEKKGSIYSEVNNLAPLGEKDKKLIIKYLDDFYEIVNDPKLIKRKVYDACEINHAHLHSAKLNK